MADCWGFTPGIAVPHRDITLRTDDGVALRASYLPGPDPRGPAVVVAPGFAGHRTKPAYALLAERLARHLAVLTVDLRGHGRSGGRCTFGVRETLDVTAAAAELRRRGHRWVAAIGTSMGGTAVLRAAGLASVPPFDAVCAISAPAVWALSGTPAMRAITRTVTVGWYRSVVGAVSHVRIAPNPWASANPEAPIDVVAAIAPVPLLLVHGTDDHFFPPEQARLLHAAAGEPRTLWLEPPGFGHAEDGLRPRFADRLAAATVAACRGDWPARPEVGPPAR
jgi:alpha-beta hydrolase superfamily lysophospholipase